MSVKFLIEKVRFERKKFIVRSDHYFEAQNLRIDMNLVVREAIASAIKVVRDQQARAQRTANNKGKGRHGKQQVSIEGEGTPHRDASDS